MASISKVYIHGNDIHVRKIVAISVLLAVQDRLNGLLAIGSASSFDLRSSEVKVVQGMEKKGEEAKICDEWRRYLYNLNVWFVSRAEAVLAPLVRVADEFSSV